MNYSIDPGTNRLLLNTNQYVYDSSGNLQTLTDPQYGQHSFLYNAMSQVYAVDNGQTGNYLYDALDQRTYKTTAAGWTGYLYHNGEVMAESHSSGIWSDFIYANGEKIAKVDIAATVLHHSGVCGACYGGLSNFVLSGLSSGVTGNTIARNDKLVFQQKQVNARAGLYMYATDGTNSMMNLFDDDGDTVNASSVADGSWHTRIVDLSGWAGKQISSNLGVSVEANTPTGVNWDSWIADVVVYGADA